MDNKGRCSCGRPEAQFQMQGTGSNAAFEPGRLCLGGYVQEQERCRSQRGPKKTGGYQALKKFAR